MAEPCFGFLDQINLSQSDSLYSLSMKYRGILNTQSIDLFNYSAYQLCYKSHQGITDIIKDFIFYISITQTSYCNKNSSISFAYFNTIKEYLLGIKKQVILEDFYTQENFESIESLFLILPFYLSTIRLYIEKNISLKKTAYDCLREFDLLLSSLRYSSNAYEKDNRKKYDYYLNQIEQLLNNLNLRKEESFIANDSSIMAKSSLDNSNSFSINIANTLNIFPKEDQTNQRNVIHLDKLFLYYKNKSSDMMMYDVSAYNNDLFQLKVIGSFSLGLNVTENSDLDLVLLAKDPNQLIIKEKDIYDWFEFFNSQKMSFIDVNSDSKISLEKNPSVRFYTLYINGFDHMKNVNLYLFKEWFWICNEVFQMIFTDQSPLIKIHSFLFPIFKQFQLLSGSELCLFLVAFLDIKYGIFDLQKKIARQRTLVGKAINTEIYLKKSPYYYYELLPNKLYNIAKKHKYELLLEIIDSLIEMLEQSKTNLIEQRLIDKHYLFRIKFLFENHDGKRTMMIKLKKTLMNITQYDSLDNYFLKEFKINTS